MKKQTEIRGFYLFIFALLLSSWTSERARPAPCAPHTRSLCVCSATENEGRPRRTITTKHIPFCPTAPAAQTETQALCVYRASQGETADLGAAAGVSLPFFSLSEENSDSVQSSRALSSQTWTQNVIRLIRTAVA